MAHWRQYNEEEGKQLLIIASGEKGLPVAAVEKDWWVTMVLKALSMTQYAELQSFKGGTSLSKGWGLIERFSEDADIALSRNDRFAISSPSNSQLAKVRRAARHYVTKELPDELTTILNGLGVTDFSVEAEINRERDGEIYELRADTHPSVIYVHYRPLAADVSSYLAPKVKIEISCLSMDEPVEEREIRSFISQARPEADDTFVRFRTVIPTRTFLEKMFLLHEEFQKEKPRSQRMSRHLYDLECMMDSPFGIEALSDRTLYDDIVKHRSIFNKQDHVDYATHAPTTINFIPPQHIIEEWRKDYEQMTDLFLYHKEKRLSFDALIGRMEELIRRVRRMV